MRDPHVARVLHLALLGAAPFGCIGEIESVSAVGPAASASAPGGSAAGATTSGLAPPGSVPATPVPERPVGRWLPARVRRLGNAEYDRTVTAVFQVGAPIAAAKFPVDFRQNDFTRNDAQQVDGAYAEAAHEAARALASQGASRLLARVGCSASAGVSCAQQFVATIGAELYRRPVTDEEKAMLTKVFTASSAGGTFGEGLEAVVAAMLASPNFLYLTELGAGPPDGDGAVRLTEHEIAAQLAYLLTGGPPDAALAAAAAAGKLADPRERASHARRLLAASGARAQATTFATEWLGLYRLGNIAKDPALFPKFTQLRPLMAKEAEAFTREALLGADSTVAKLLTAASTVTDEALARFYAPAPRRGLLMQGAFLSVFAHDHDTAPVKRGAAILERVLCAPVPSPGELDIAVVPPPPDPRKTTRERYAQHATNPACAGCHRKIDPLGFALEGFDAMGGRRTTENGRPVDTAVELDVGGLTGPARDGWEMVMKVAASDAAAECFARQLFRFAAARPGGEHEELFLRDVWSRMPAATRANAPEVLVALVTSDLFVKRSVR